MASRKRPEAEEPGEGAAPSRKPPPALATAYAYKIRPSLAVELLGKPTAWIPAPARAHAVGDRLLLKEWAGAATGRADLVKVLRFSDDRSTCEVDRRWCWRRGKDDADLTSLGYAVEEMPTLLGAV